MKKLLAILCVVAVLFCSLFTGVVVSAEDADSKLTTLSPIVDQMSASLADPEHPANYRKPFHNATYSAMVQTIGAGQAYVSFNNGNTYFRIVFHNANQVQFVTKGLTTVNGLELAPYTTGGDFKNRFFELKVTSQVVNEKLNITVMLDGELAGDFTFNEANAFDAEYGTRMFCGVYVYDPEYELRDDEIIDSGMLLPEKTLTDYGLEEGPYYHSDPGDHVAKSGRVTSSLNTLFSMNFMLETNGFVRYPSFSNRKGFTLKAVGNDLVLDGSALATELELNDASKLATITAADLGLASILGADLKYQVAIEICNTDDDFIKNPDGSLCPINNDVRFSFYLNGYKFYEAEVPGVAVSWEPVTDESGNAIGVKNLVSEGGIALFEKVPAPEGQTGTYTLNTLYIKNGEFTNYTTPIPALPVKTYADDKFTNFVTDANGQVNLIASPALNTIFSTKVTFNKTSAQYFFSQLGAFSLEANTGKLVFNDLAKPTYLTDYDMLGKEFDLKIVSKGVSIDDGAYPNDLQLQIFIDNVLKYTAYHKDAVGQKTSKGSYINPNNDITLARPDFVPNGLQQLTPADGGFDEDRTITFPATAENKHEDDYITGSELYINYNKQANSALNLLGSLFTAKITNNLEVGSVDLFNNGGTQIKCTIDAANKIQIYANGNFFTVAKPIPVAKGTEFTFQFTVHYSDFDEDANGLLDDIRIGLFFDGQLLGGKYITLLDRDIRSYPVNETTKADLISWTNFNFRTQAYCSTGASTTTGSITIKNPVDLSEAYKNYETITLDDFGVIPGTYKPNASNNINASWVLSNNVLSVNGKVLKATLKISKSSGNQWLSFGGNGIGSHGLHFKFDANGAIFNPSKGTATGYRLETFEYDKEQEWFVTYDFEADGKIKLGVWIDKKLQNNAFFYVSGYVMNSHMRTLLLYKPSDTACITFGDAKNYTNAEIAEGGYLFKPAAGDVYNYEGTEITSAAPYTFTTVGEYAVTYTAKKGTNEIEGTKTIVVFKANDLNADNDVNILDFIIAKKNAAGERELSTALARAAAGKYDVTELCDAYDIADIKALILG